MFAAIYYLADLNLLKCQKLPLPSVKWKMTGCVGTAKSCPTDDDVIAAAGVLCGGDCRLLDDCCRWDLLYQH